MKSSTPLPVSPPPDPSNETYRLEYWAEGVFQAELLSRETADGFAFVCEECGHRMWGAKYFPNRALIKFYSACPAHPPTRGEIPGSMICWWSDELERMPAALVEREYALHLAYYERITHERDTLKQAA